MCEITYMRNNNGLKNREKIKDIVWGMFQRNSHGVGFIINRELFSKSTDINKVYKDLDEYKGKITEIIIHARLATTGVQDENNSQPIVSDNGRYLVLHNGIFNNLGNPQHSDTAVFTALIEQAEGNIPLALDQAEGWYSMFILDLQTKDLVYLKSDTPSFNGVFLLTNKTVICATKIKHVMEDFASHTYFGVFKKKAKYDLAKFKPETYVVYRIDGETGFWEECGKIEKKQTTYPVYKTYTAGVQKTIGWNQEFAD